MEGKAKMSIPETQTTQSTSEAALLAAAEKAANYLSELYAKYQRKIGPFASQAMVINCELRAAMKAAKAAKGYSST